MNQPKEIAWERMFAHDLPAVRPAKIPHECSEACLMAREVKCTCTACRGARHGAHLKKDVKRLDNFNDDEEEEGTEDAQRYIA